MTAAAVATAAATVDGQASAVPSPPPPRSISDLARRAFAEALGTGLLVCTVVGSGIAASRLSPTDTGLQLLENAIATAAVLAGLILTLGPISGAHFNPVVTLADRALGRRTNRDVLAYIPAQILGGASGAIIANAMFERPLLETASQVRSGGGLWMSEVVATFGLLLLIFGMTKARDHPHVPFAVAGYVTGAYWFTSSTSFANPAVTIARTLSDSFAGIAPASAPAFIAAQVIGAGLALGAVKVLIPCSSANPHPESEQDLVPLEIPAAMPGGAEKILVLRASTATFDV